MIMKMRSRNVRSSVLICALIVIDPSGVIR
jgi:hypothetical protein